MKKISIRATDADALRDYAARINGSATSHTADAEAIMKAGREIEERRVATRLPKDDCIGMVAEFLTAGPEATPSRAVVGSRVLFRYVKSEQDGVRTREWRVVSIERVDRWSKDRETVRLIVTPEQADAIRARSVADLVIRAA